MAHSNQIREFLITAEGIELLDVYVGPEGVLTGSMRAAQEAREQAAAIGAAGDRAQAARASAKRSAEARAPARRARGQTKIVAEQRAREQQFNGTVRRGADAARTERKR